MTQSAASSSVSTESVVKCVKLSKVFKDFWLRNRVKAVDQIDLDIRRGEVFGLLGPNGSGKSTTIKMILGLLHSTSGHIAVFGNMPKDVETKKRIGYLPEESYLYRFLNARETLDYYGRLFHQSRAQRKQRIDMLLEMVGLDRVAHRPVGEYSKGMQRRIGLAQALINDPELLILDEPTTGLDPIGTKQIKDLIQQLSEKGKTILLCSHLLTDVQDVCDRVAIMYGGKVRQSGTVDELLIKEETTTLKVDHLDPAIIEEIEQVLARHNKCIDAVEHPTQRLEDLFLDIVHKAQKDGVATHGASAGGDIASFLTAEDTAAHMPEQTTEAVLEDLMSDNKVEQVEENVETVEEVKTTETDETIASLMEETPAVEPEAAKKPEAAAPSEKKSDGDQSVIDDLL
ncbi:ABC transporter ATP-binding protein [Planctomycetota bacterium]|nr:ABC transporter ATP-binding protein [Planctomycetota bacterium]